MLPEYLQRFYYRQQWPSVAFLLVTVFIMGISVISMKLSGDQYQSHLMRHGRQVAEHLARQSGQALMQHSPETIQTTVFNAVAFSDVLRVQVDDLSQKTLVVAEKPGAPSDLPPRHVPPSADAHAVLEQETAHEWVFMAPGDAATQNAPERRQMPSG